MLVTDAAPPPPRWSWWRRISVTFGVLFAGWLAFQLWPVWLEPGPNTTVITGPLRPNGTVDYAAALNAERSQGVTPENNAVVLLIQATGPGIINSAIAGPYFEALGIEMPPLDGPYLQEIQKVFPDDRDRSQRAIEHLDDAMKRPWDADDHPELAAWLEANEDPLLMCAAACERDRYFDPLITPPGGTMLDLALPLVQECRNLSRLLAIRATWHLRAGRIDEALEDSQTLHRLSRLIAQHPVLISQMVAYGTFAMACHADAALIHSGRLTVEQARRQREFCAALPPFPSVVDVIDRGERFVSLDAVQVQFLRPGFQLGWLQPNALLHRFNEGFDNQVAAMRLPDRAEQHAAIEQALAELRDSSRMDARNIVRFALNPRRRLVTSTADVMLGLIYPASEAALVSQRRTEVRQTLDGLGFALAEYRARHNQFPQTLDALVPEILDRVPPDPFSDQPLHYLVDADAGTILLYSIGENGVDDHGRMNSATKADDIAFGAVRE